MAKIISAGTQTTLVQDETFTSAPNITTAGESASAASNSASSAATSATAAAASATSASSSAGSAATSSIGWAFKYAYATSTTMADPGTGTIRFDNATLASVTNIAFDATTADSGNPDISDYIASWDDGTNSAHEGYLTIRKADTPATFMVYSITSAVTDNTGWLQVPVTHVSSNGSLSASDDLLVICARE